MSDLVIVSLISGTFGLASIGANAFIAARAAKVLALAGTMLAKTAEANHSAIGVVAEIAKANVELVKTVIK